MIRQLTEIETLINQSLEAKKCTTATDASEAKVIVSKLTAEIKAAKKNSSLATQVARDKEAVVSLYERLPLEGQVNSSSGTAAAATRMCPENFEESIFPGARKVFEKFFDKQGIYIFKQATAETVQKLKDRVAKIDTAGSPLPAPPTGTLVEVPLSDARNRDGSSTSAVFAFDGNKGDVNKAKEFYIKTVAARRFVASYSGPFSVLPPLNLIQTLAAEKMKSVGPEDRLKQKPNVKGAPSYPLPGGTDDQETVYLVRDPKGGDHMIVKVVGIAGEPLAQWYDCGPAPIIEMKP